MTYILLASIYDDPGNNINTIYKYLNFILLFNICYNSLIVIHDCKFFMNNWIQLWLIISLKLEYWFKRKCGSMPRCFTLFMIYILEKLRGPDKNFLWLKALHHHVVQDLWKEVVNAVKLKVKKLLNNIGVLCLFNI